jgi:hypothetical protein
MKMKTTLAIFLLIFSIQVFAQKTYRRANVRIELTGPPEGTTLRQGKQITYSFKLINTSDVPILKTDTVVYRPAYSYSTEGIIKEGKTSLPKVILPGDSIEFFDTLTIQVVRTSLNRKSIDFSVYSFVYGPSTEMYTVLNWEPFSEQEDNTSRRSYAFDGFLNTSNFQLTNIKIFPNPAESYIQIESEHGIISYQVWSLEGVSVIKNDIRSSTTIPISDLPSGIYLLKLRDEHGQVYTSKFIKI